MAPRNCADCHRCLSKDCFSRNQWTKGAGISRCTACVTGVTQSTSGDNVVDATLTARLNNASCATFSHDALDHPFAQGSFRWVAKGTYTVGTRAGQQCVCKWFKTGGVIESHFYDSDLAASNEAIRLITQWNANKIINKMVQVNLPEVWTFTNDSGSRAGKKVLQEPFIENYDKFNSNTGWADDSIPWSRVMQALSHYTYHISNGQTLLCDLQGGVYQTGVVLTDPVVMSMSRSFGPTDLGSPGISTFFAHHKCNEYCRSDWQRPRNQTPYYQRSAGTTMEHVPTRQSRSNMTMGAIHEY